jgi:hypothetical protein
VTAGRRIGKRRIVLAFFWRSAAKWADTFKLLVVLGSPVIAGMARQVI